MDEKYNFQLTKIILCAADFALISVIFVIIQKSDFIQLSKENLYFLSLIFGFSWVATGLFTGIYDIGKYSLIRTLSINLFSTLLFHVILIYLTLYSMIAHSIPLKSLLTVYLFISLAMMGSRIVYKLVWKYFEFSGFDLRRVVIVGTTRSGKALHDFFTLQGGSRYIFKGFFDNYPNPDIVNRKLVRGTVDDLNAYCIRENIDEIYFALPLIHKDLIKRLGKFADDNCIYLRIAPDFSEVVHNSHNVFLYDSIPVLTTRKEPLGLFVNAALKRAFDIVFSLSVIIFIFPIIVPIIALAIVWDSEGPVVFKQLRPGKKNKLFECYKFRTMHINGSTEKMAVKGDPRITRVGAFLRKTSLDELPQFANVLLGDMSVVGPRPNLLSQLEEYSKSLQKYKVRHFISPGITGYAQVNGFRGEIKEKESMEKRVEYDVAYMENWSLLLDLKIIFQTVRKIIKGDKHAY
ncbi:exopolysaccharide biosynthesis polyprenyl glycosylphosphotransferase [Fulvivirga sp. 29W222]|uniref:Exopolysaccharide biosynthesis polyprenyl glycosylphosphotransferase n=1 Tax=Fulvivirga marina TaxID=2494733 RepID=A0A937KD48_9BACT|nr:exopolysaccharide biosynthesis polyprenyl glycosylphosphotransferase [Fulvivirga marina]MBL6448099.1 exopolysaccharide biosynthesis polyprenyl glycosylphosphotransferase [Fulvivirga marina]